MYIYMCICVYICAMSYNFHGESMMISMAMDFTKDAGDFPWGFSELFRCWGRSRFGRSDMFSKRKKRLLMGIIEDMI